MSDDLLSMFNALDDTPVVRAEIIRSPLNYAGSKFESLEQILPLIPYTDICVEVFGGSGSFILARRRSKLDVFNDRNSGISAFFIACQTEPDRLIEIIKHLPHSREIYDWCQKNYDNLIHDTTLRGAMFYYMVQSSFGGRCDYFGRTISAKGSPVFTKLYNNLELFPAIIQRFRSIQVENLDWRVCLKDFDSPETVFYLDPPYVNSNIYAYNMSKQEHMEMCERIFQLEGFVALSGYANDIYSKYPWDGVHVIEVPNNVVGCAFDENNNMQGKEHLVSRAGKRDEYLWIKEAK